jgi:uncharacterized surface protein with fasciclin (FAS1) repeats
MQSRLIALVLLTVGACAKTDTASQTPEPAEAPEAPADDAAAADDEAAPPAPAAESKPEAAAPAAEKNLVAVVGALENGKTFAELLTASELDKELQSPDVSLTLLVPTDAAFAKLPKGTVDKWKKNKDQLQKILKYHFIPGVNNAAKIGNYRTAPTAAGTELPVKSSQDSDMTIDGARITESDIEASNGMVHVIDKVLQPSNKKK